jgi:transcriptional regulator with XRE-family HTH domain
MTFNEKIDKILKDNKLGVNSVSALEDKLGVSRGSINGFYKEGRSPGLKILKKIKEFPGLNLEWWETEKGDPFGKNITPVTILDQQPIRQYPDLMDIMQELHEADTREIKRLTKDIERLTKELEECRRAAGGA